MFSGLAQAQERLPFDVLVEGVLTREEVLEPTPALLATRPAVEAVFVERFELVPPSDGTYTLELCAWHFDGYLILRDLAGEILYEDDNGLRAIHPKIVAQELKAGERYFLEVCLRDGEPGPFELLARTGLAPTLTPDEEIRLNTYDMERLSVALAERFGEDFQGLPPLFDNLTRSYYSQGRLAEAESAQERMLAVQERILGTGDPELARYLGNISTLRAEQGRLAEAIEPQRRALELLEAAYGPEHPETLAELHDYGVFLAKAGEHEEARRVQAEALERCERALGLEHPVSYEVERSLGMELAQLGQLDLARTHLERALATAESIWGRDDPQTASVLEALGGTLLKLAELEEALGVQERALAIREARLGPNDRSTGISHSNLADVLRARGEFDRARAHYEAALAIWEAVLGPDHRMTVTGLNNLGSLYLTLGEPARAEATLERALRALERIHGRGHPETVAPLSNLALAWYERGALARAREAAEEALAITLAAKGEDHADTAQSLNNLAQMLDAQGNHAEAMALQERSLSVYERSLGPDHPELAKSLTGLGAALLREGRAEEAEAHMRRAHAICVKALGAEHPGTANVANSLAFLLEERGKLASAQELREEILRVTEARLGSDHPHTAGARGNLGGLLEGQGELKRALPYYEAALEDLEGSLGLEHTMTARTIQNVAVLRANLGRFAEARELLLRTAAARTQHVQRTLAGLTEAEGFRYLGGLRYQLDVLLSLVPLGGGEHASAAYPSVLAWKGQVGRALIASRELVSRSLDEGTRELVDRLRANQGELSWLLSSDPGNTPRLSALSEERNRIELELARSEGEAGASDNATLEDLQRALPPGSASIDFLIQPVYRLARWDGEELLAAGSWSDLRYVCWIVRPEVEEVVRVDLGPVEEGDARVGAHLRWLLGASLETDSRGLPPAAVSTDEGGAAAPEELRRWLWDALAPHLEGVGTLVVSPDGALGTLPFETLLLESGAFLIEHQAIVYRSDLAGLSSEPAIPNDLQGGLLAVGDVDFDRHASGEPEPPASILAASASNLRGAVEAGWSALPATGAEVCSLAELHSRETGAEARLLLGSEPTEERLKRELESATVLHLATHGFFAKGEIASKWESARAERSGDSGSFDSAAATVGNHPGLLSGLVCAGANAPADPTREDGLLTAEEVGWLDLDQAELVVLSACETGLGKSRGGESLIGLRRAFRTAGAATVVSSLWKVEDQATAELMTSFYTNLFALGLGRHEALRQAQLAMLERNRREHGQALPATWGAFVLSGEWR